CRWLQMKFDLQRVIIYIIVVYVCVADVADKTSNLNSKEEAKDRKAHFIAFMLKLYLYGYINQIKLKRT
ncbi:MAG: hypothetical protein ACRDD8_06770, partial [Bacteroidales bacterium]